jgi:predicted RNA-binding protein associated with RNAse of E/G family
MKKHLLKDRFQQLSGIKPLYESTEIKNPTKIEDIKYEIDIAFDLAKELLRYQKEEISWEEMKANMIKLMYKSNISKGHEDYFIEFIDTNKDNKLPNSSSGSFFTALIDVDGIISNFEEETLSDDVFDQAYDYFKQKRRGLFENNNSQKKKDLSEDNNPYIRVSQPRMVKDKNNPNFLNIYIDYDLGPGGNPIALGKETMTGQIRRESAAKAMEIAQTIIKKLESKYNIEDIDVEDLQNGKVRVFAVSDDFINMAPSSLDEAKISHIVGGIPYKRTRKSKEDKIEIFQKLDEPIKIKLIKKFKEKNWEVNPNEKGGLTATKKLMSIPEEMDINDPMLIKFRAAKYDREKLASQPQSTPLKPTKTINPDYKAIKNASKIDFLQKEKDQLLRDMEQEAEPEGGPIADRYGRKLNKIDQAIAMLSEAKSNPEIDKLLNIINTKKAGSEYKKALMDLIAIAEKKSGKTIQTKKEALLALDYVEPTINESLKDIQKIKEFFTKPLNEANGFKSGKEFINIKLKNYPKAVAKVNQLINMIGESNFTMEMAEWIFDFFNNASFESPVNEAKKEDKVDTITMDIPLFLRMLEYSREDASQDMDLHDVTEKSNLLGKERGILSMEDYEEIVGSAEDTPEKELNEANVPSNIRDFAKRKGVSSLVNKVAGWAEKVGARIAGGTAIGMNYSTLVLDLDYKQQGEIRINTDNETIKLYDEPVDNFNAFQRVYVDYKDLDENVAPNHNGKSSPYGSGYKPLEEKIAKALDKIKEGGPGLWANIHAQRKRGEKPSPKGSKDYKAAVAAGKRINKEK